MITETTKRCPYCSEEILATAIKCKHCHTMLNDSSYMETKGPTTATSLAFTSKYDILEKIGSGGMANVYKAKQKSLGRLVALKVFHQSMMQDTELFERFQREARICATLKHPNIVDVYDIGYENGQHFISMEYISGINLHQLIREKGKLDSDHTVRIVLSIAEALDYAHSKGIVHRDIKSSNILISDEGSIYLAEFGIAHTAHESKITLPQEALGTPEYMSPEQIEMQELTGATDFYSLGIVMYECLTGHVPFSSVNPLLVLDKIRRGDTPDVSKERPGLDDNIVLTNICLLDKNINKRIRSVKELKELLALNQSTSNYDNTLYNNLNSSIISDENNFYKVKVNGESLKTEFDGEYYVGPKTKKYFSKEQIEANKLFHEFYGNISDRRNWRTDRFNNIEEVLTEISLLDLSSLGMYSHLIRARRVWELYKSFSQNYSFSTGHTVAHFWSENLSDLIDNTFIKEKSLVKCIESGNNYKIPRAIDSSEGSKEFLALNTYTYNVRFFAGFPIDFRGCTGQLINNTNNSFDDAYFYGLKEEIIHFTKAMEIFVVRNI